MTEFISRLKKLEVRLIRKTLMQRKLYKMSQAILDLANFSLIQSQSRMEQEQKDMETLLNTVYRKYSRRSAKPKFLAG